MPVPSERLQVKLLRTPPSYTEDVAVVTFHFTDYSVDAGGGQFGGPLTETKRAAVETAVSAFWAYYRQNVHTWISLVEYRWYDQKVWPTPSPLIRLTTPVPSSGTSALTTCLPPQCACSITEETGVRRRWGRSYWPFSNPANVTNVGRYPNAVIDGIATNAKTMYDAFTAAGANAVVYSPKGVIGPPPAEAGSVLLVNQLRVDDIVDIVRRRRWESVIDREIRDLA